MKYAINILRMEVSRIESNLVELLLKLEEVPVVPQTAGSREQVAHLRGLNSNRLKELKDAIEKLEK